tara:strand:- start:3699 stop:4496 length:798 start_codon:yes stop_codon:yes gene_type:complete
MNKPYQFCNNCGRSGHLFHSCKKPITSSGIACFKKDIRGNLEYLLICRKDTLGYVDFIRGKYPLYNVSYIQNLINEMTIEEKNKILTKDFKFLWNELWGNFSGQQYTCEEKNSNQKLLQLKDGIYIDNEFFDLNKLIETSNTNWVNPEWGFPKGRRNYQENDIKCATREFIEETGFHENDFVIIKNVLPFEEVFMGSNFKSYKHKYYLAYMMNERNLLNFQKSEVSKMKWVSLDECLSLIRPYNIEKKDLIKRIDKILHKYSLFS